MLLVGDLHQAEDLVQEALWRTHRHWRSAAAHPDAYVRRVLVNLTHDRHRRRVRRVAETSLDPGQHAVAVDEVTALLARDELVSALRQLAPRQRATLVLRFWEDLSIEDTAAILDCAPGTVKSNTSKGLERIRTLLEAVPDEQGSM
ncbi:SigE family RNA polymerase sigma factor [Acidothermaceae bacterium B102]|nr:SigE family RNA polymerase sigma factor [Acidothermaceae bacterium B102]